MRYAEIDENGICFAISDMQKTDHPRLIRLYRYQDVLGYTWDGEKWNQPDVIDTLGETEREREYDRLILSPKDLTELLNVATECGNVIIRVPRMEVLNER